MKSYSRQNDLSLIAHNQTESTVYDQSARQQH